MNSEDSHHINLEAADEVIVTCVTDNYADRLEPGSDFIHRFPLSENENLRVGPLAEHGFSVLVQVKRGTESHTILFDTGVTPTTMAHNMKALKIDPEQIEAIVLSHGHIDHGGGLSVVLSQIKDRKVPLVLHPHGLRKRYLIKPDGEKTDISILDAASLEAQGAEIIESVKPYLMAGGLAAASGQVRRQADFEKGFPFGFAEIDGKVAEDFETIDDQAIVLNLKDKGLIVISGCGHAGIVNTALHCKEITGIDKMHLIMGGFHLTGAFYEPVIDKTVAAIRELDPSYVIPCHCTGWKAIHKFAREMPESFIQNAVGTTYVFQ